MIYKLNVEKDDYDHLNEIKPLVSAFNRAVQFSIAAMPEGRNRVKDVTTLADEQEFTEIAEVYQSFAEHERYYDSKEANSIHAVMTMSLKDHFMSIIRRAVPDEQLAAHVPPALAHERHVALLEKYRLPALAAIVRSASPKPVAN